MNTIRTKEDRVNINDLDQTVQIKLDQCLSCLHGSDG